MRPDPQTLPVLRARLLLAVGAACPALSAADREDVVQGVLARLVALDAAGEWNEARPASYVWKMAFHAAVDELRRRQAAPAVGLPEGEQAEPASPAASPESAVADLQLGGAIRACLGGLAGDRRAAVTLFLQGHAAREVSLLLCFPLKKVENLIFRGVADLRRCLGSKGFDR